MHYDVPPKKFFVSKHLYSNTIFSANFFKYINEIYADSSNPYSCSAISDIDFVKLGVLRCLSYAQTGQGFLQDHGNVFQIIDPSHFFKMLKSERRLENTSSINELLRRTMKSEIADPFAQYNELKNFDIYAADGHYHHAAAFDPKPTSKNEKTIPTGHFFRLDLRTHHAGHLCLGVPNCGKKSAHDITIIKRSTSETLRNNAPKGRQIIYAWDKACIDYGMWSKLKHSSGIYFITLEKSNSAATVSSENIFDSTDPRNQGIVSDQLVSPSYGDVLRRIVYIDPRDDKTYVYLTNQLNVPAYQLVMIYKIRWDIEKVFYQFKTKMGERRSWGSSKSAKSHQAIFLCLAHNLSLLMEEEIKRQGLVDEVEEKKKIGREKSRRNKEGDLMKKATHFIGTAITRASHRTVRFIRWLRAALYSTDSVSIALERLIATWHEKKS